MLKKDPFWVFRNCGLNDDELFHMYFILGWDDDWEYNNAVDYMAQRILLEDL